MSKRKAPPGSKRNIFGGNKNPDVPSCTKVVRLIVCKPGFKWDDVATVRALANKRYATRQDVFIVKRGEEWEPMTWLGDALVEHHEAMEKDKLTVTRLSVKNREQLQWECDVPFRIKAI